MPTVLKEFRFRTGNKYLSLKYTDGRIWKFKRGVDFDCEIGLFRSHVAQFAKRLGLNYMTNRDPFDNQSLVIQFTKPTKRTKPTKKNRKAT